SLRAFPSPLIEGTRVNLEAAVSGGTAATGSVQFKLNGADFESPVPLYQGYAQLETTQLPRGNYIASAVYKGDFRNSPSQSGDVAFALTKAPCQDPQALKNRLYETIRFTRTSSGGGFDGTIETKHYL